MRAAVRIVTKAKCFHGNTASSASNLSFQAQQCEDQKRTGSGDASFCSWIFLLIPSLCLHLFSLEFKQLKPCYTFNIKSNLYSERF